MSEPPAPTVVVVRHGETEWSREGRHTGRTDVPLDDEGRRQAEALKGELAGWSFALVLTSTLARATETCALAGFAGAARATEDLCEWDYGDYEGLTTPQIRETRPDWNLWADGVPGGESAADVGRRADRVIEEARAAGGDTLLVAHGHLLRVLSARWVGLPPIAGRLLTLAPASVGELAWEREVPVIERWNQRSRRGP